MVKQKYYDTTGNIIAFRRKSEDKLLFNKDGYIIGWFPKGDDHAASVSGGYLGSVVGDRLVQIMTPPSRSYPGYSVYAYAGYPGYSFKGYRRPSKTRRDVPQSLLERR